MPIPFETPIATTTANGVTTLFPHSFTVLDTADLVVKTELSGVVSYPVEGVDYTVAGIGSSSGSITFASPPANGTKVTRYRDTALERTTDYQENGDLLAATLDQDIDRVVMMVQELFAGGKGAPTSIRVPNGETVGELPSAADRALRILSFDSLGAPLLIPGVVSDSAVALALDLSSSVSASKGAGQVGFNAAISYSAGTVGYTLKSVAALTSAMPWANLTGKPTTKSGYGITDMPSYSDLLAESNLVTNPAFAINQRGYVSGTATVGANQVTLDRWRVVTSGQALTFAASGAGNIVTAPAGGIEQVIRGANVRGGTYTVAWTGTATCTVNGVAATNGSQVTLPANTNVSLKFASGTVSEVMLIPGQNVVAFVLRPYFEELNRCQAEYWVLGHVITIQGNASTGGDRVYCNIQFPTQMGASPTITSGWASATNVSANTIQAADAGGFLLVIQATNPGAFAVNYSSGNSASTGI